MSKIQAKLGSADSIELLLEQIVGISTPTELHGFVSFSPNPDYILFGWSFGACPSRPIHKDDILQLSLNNTHNCIGPGGMMWSATVILSRDRFMKHAYINGRNTMPREKKVYSDAASFFKELTQKPESLPMEGFLEQSDEGDTVRFAPYGNCKHWMTLPAAAIKEIEIIRQNAPCYTEEEGQHWHPYVSLAIDLESSGVAKALAGLAYRAISQRPHTVESIRPIQPTGIQEPFFMGPSAGYMGQSIGTPPVGANQNPPGLFYLGAQAGGGVRPLRNCQAGYRCVYHAPCPWGCACVNDDGWAYCGTCCVS